MYFHYALVKRLVVAGEGPSRIVRFAAGIRKVREHQTNLQSLQQQIKMIVIDNKHSYPLVTSLKTLHMTAFVPQIFFLNNGLLTLLIILIQ